MRLLVFWFKSVVILIWLSFWFLFGTIFGLLRYGDRNLSHIMSRIVCPFVLWVAGFRVKVIGEEKLAGSEPRIFLSNHQSMMDLMTLASVCPEQTVFVGKQEVLYIPFVNLFFLAGGNIAIKRHDRTHSLAGMSQAAKIMRDERASVWMFPEGTRNKTNAPLGSFKKGAFYMGIEAQVPLVPIVSGPLESFFSWKKKHYGQGTLWIKVLDPIPTQGLNKDQVDQLLAHTRAQMEAAVKELTALQASG